MKNIPLLLLSLFCLSCDVIPINYPVDNPNSTNNSNAEFKSLWEKDKINKKQVNAQVLTYLLNDTNPKETFTAASIENTSRCNMILRMVGISGGEIYNLPIQANSKNQFIIKKGNYTLKSNICGANYYSQKNISDPLILKLSSN